MGIALGGFSVKGGLGVGAFLLAYFVLLALVHAGAFAGRRWAFVGTALLAAVSLSGQHFHLGPKLLLSTALWTLAYSLLRAIPVFGPKPR